MKSRILMATLVVTLLLGARIYAGDCGACDPACDPCGEVGCGKTCDLFSGLRKLVAGSPCAVSECGPCDGVVACSPCDVACDPCDEVGCDDGCGPKFKFRKRLRAFFSMRDGCGPCDGVCDDGCGPCDDLCGPCDNDCGPCDDLGCNDGCGRSCFSLKKFFKGFRLAGRCNDGCSDPCDAACGACDDSCGPCDDLCGPCDDSCSPCDGCNDGCGRKFGRLFDKPRRNVKKFFDGFRFGGCGPCDAACNPCDISCDYGCPATSQLPEAAK